MTSKLVPVVCLVVLASCAKSPEKIAAVEIGADAYGRYSCAQLTTEKLKISQDLENLSAKQEDAASGDAVGVLLLGLPLSSMSGNDQEAAIAIAKGKVQAIDQQVLAKRCK